jgi:azurin
MGSWVPLCCALLLTSGSASAEAYGTGSPQAASGAPHILYDVSPRAVDYQLARLSADELSRVERNDSDPKYRPVYLAILTRPGMGRAAFDEALSALQKLDHASRTKVVLDALRAVDPADDQTAGKLLAALLAQPAAALSSDRASLEAAASDGSSALVRRAGYAGSLAAGGQLQAIWQAAERGGHLADLLRAVPALPAGTPARPGLTPLVARQAADAPDAATRAAALTALAALRPDAQTFDLLGTALRQAEDSETRMAAMKGLQQVPAAARPAGSVEPVVSALGTFLRGTPPEARTSPVGLEAAQLGAALAEGLPDSAGRPLRRELRELGVQVVRIATIPEQMRFDRQWFVVEAGKPVQIVLSNPDTMSHNLVVGQPGSVRAIGTAAAAMPAPVDGSAKAYVPAMPEVLKATNLLNWGETARLDLVAPADPGSYVFLCTFPGHWVRMYGIMLVVPNLDDWERTRTPPLDPVTGRAFEVLK